MRTVRLERRASAPTGTPGRISVPDLGVAWHSLELPWAENEPRYSCIEAGRYLGILDTTSKWSPRPDGALYHLVQVPGRSLIKIHAATWAGDEREGWYSELLGCIAPGSSVGMLKPPGYPREQPCLLRSRDALRELMACLEGDTIELIVTWAQGAEPTRATV